MAPLHSTAKDKSMHLSNKEKGGGEKKVGEAAVTYLQGNITYVPVDM